MVGDSVREELAGKVKVIREKPTTKNRSTKSAVQKNSARIKLNPSPSPIVIEPKIKSATAEISAKKTNRTLVEFQSKDGTLPEWRTRLRSAVRQRKLQNSPDSVTNETTGDYPSNDSIQSEHDFFDAAEIIEEKKDEPPQNELLAGALARINHSREKYHVVGKTLAVSIADEVAVEPAARIAEPLSIASGPEITTESKTSVNFPKAPVYSPKVDLYNTSELDPEFPPAAVSSSFGRVAVKTSARPDAAEAAEPNEIVETKLETKTEPVKTEVYEDDSAPFAYRFNAGLFDTILASFASLVLLAPFALLGGSWFSVSGIFAFLATGSIVNFIYLTTTIGLFGKSFGMHLFSLEMIDADGDEYPSFHQAAVSSSVFLLSMAFGGIGFLSCLIDDDRRAIHDMVSNTLVVREL